jgi:hypothetical protein
MISQDFFQLFSDVLPLRNKSNLFTPSVATEVPTFFIWMSTGKETIPLRWAGMGIGDKPNAVTQGRWLLWRASRASLLASMAALACFSAALAARSASMAACFVRDEIVTNHYQPDETESRPYGRDEIEAMSGPKLSSPYILFGSLMLFLASMYFSNKGLDRKPFGAQHLLFWLCGVICCAVLGLGSISWVVSYIWVMT